MTERWVGRVVKVDRQRLRVWVAPEASCSDPGESWQQYQAGPGLPLPDSMRGIQLASRVTVDGKIVRRWRLTRVL